MSDSVSVLLYIDMREKCGLCILKMSWYFIISCCIDFGLTKFVNNSTVYEIAIINVIIYKILYRCFVFI